MKKVGNKLAKQSEPVVRKSIAPHPEDAHHHSKKKLGAEVGSARSPKALLPVHKQSGKLLKSPKVTVPLEIPCRRLNQPRKSRTPPKIHFNFDIKTLNFFRSGASKKKNRRRKTEARSRSPVSEKKVSKRKDLSPAYNKSKLPVKLGNHRKSRSQEIFPHILTRKPLQTEYEADAAVVKYAIRSKPGRCDNKPKVNQDAIICLPSFLNPNTSMFGVCDGHGINGHFVSEFVKEILPNNLQYFCIKGKLLQRNLANKEVAAIIEMAFKKTSQDLKTSEIDTMFSGSTASTVFINHGKLYCANIGDSRAVIYRQDNATDKWSHRTLSTDHTAEVEKQATRILKCNGRLEPYRDDQGRQVGPYRIWLQHDQLPGLAMTRSFGDSLASTVGVTSEPEITCHEISTEDKFMIIATDGLWQFVTCEQAMAIVIPSFLRNDPDEGAKQLQKMALQYWSRQENVIDDISIIVAFFRNY